jgi:hypothetical protein
VTGDKASDTYKTWREMVNRPRITDGKSDAAVDELEDEDDTKLESANRSLILKSGKTECRSQFERKPSSEDPPVEQQIGICRRESVPTNLTVQGSDLDTWIKSIEDEHRQITGQLKPFIMINEQLQNMLTIPEDRDAIRRQIHKIVEHFGERASFEMPELVQMMTTEIGSKADRAGCFKWGFHLVVARNDVNLQLLIFCLALLFIWIYDPISSRPIQSIASFLYRVLCAPPPGKGSWPPLLLFGLRMMAFSAAVRSWVSYYDLIIFLAQCLAAPNPAWESAMKLKAVSMSPATRRKVYMVVTIANLMSCSRSASALLGISLERSLYLAWLTFFWSTVVPSLWFAKDWFRLHHNTSLRVYSLGSFLSLTVFICSMLSSMQNRVVY